MLSTCIFKHGLLIFILAGNLFATLLPFPSNLPKVNQSYDSILLKTWQGIKKRNIDPYDIKLVHRPKSETPHDAVSEGVGYGMLLALYCNDQEYFNKIWLTAEKYMWQGEYYDWNIDKDGKKIGTGAATDAEEDVALALIFADLLVKKNVWTLSSTNNSGISYGTRAKSILASIKKNMIDGSYLRPGAGWGGKEFVNPGYFAPAWYKVFAEYDSTGKSTWNSLVDQCYKTIGLSMGYSNGLIPDWMVPTGGFYTGPLGYNPTGNGRWLYKDAIRVYWRLATDYLWYDEPRARTFLQKAMNFIKEPSRANFYQMDGNPFPDSSFALGNGVVRPRSEHSHLTIAMWACASMVSGVDTAGKFSDELLKYYDDGADYWGRASDANGEDTLHNEMYFDQFLAFFGSSLISGVFTNLWEDMKDPDPTVKLAWVIIPSVNTTNLNSDNGPLKITGELNKPAKWTITLTNRDSSNESIFFSGSGSKIDVTWYGLSDSGKAMTQGYYDIAVNAKNLDVPVNSEVWLGKSLSLLVNNRLIIDDFRDGDLKPFFGNEWTSFLDSYEGKSGASSVKKIAVESSGNTKQLCWQYLLNAGNLGFDPYAALEIDLINNGKLFDLNGVDTIIVNASAKSPVGVSFQIITDSIYKAGDYHFFDDSLYFTTTQKEFKIVVSKLKQRMNGSGARLDLTKIRAFRFQVQQKTGTENEIQIGKLLLGGDVSRIYTAPPEYKNIGVVNKYKYVNTHNIISKINVTSKVISILTKQIVKNGSLQIASASGRVLYQTSIVNSNLIQWSGNGRGVAPGVYFILLKDNLRGSVKVPLTILR